MAGAPPTPAELERFKAAFPGVIKAQSGLVRYEIHGDDIAPESRRNLHQKVLTRTFAFVKRHNVSLNLAATISAIARRTVKAYLRDRRTRARVAGAARPEPDEDGVDAEPAAFRQLLLNEAAELLSTEDADLLRGSDVEAVMTHSSPMQPRWSLNSATSKSQR